MLKFNANVLISLKKQQQQQSKTVKILGDTFKLSI